MGDSDVDFIVDRRVGGVVEEDRVEGAGVEDGEEGGGGISEEVGEDWLGGGEVEVGDFKRFRVDWEDRRRW